VQTKVWILRSLVVIMFTGLATILQLPGNLSPVAPIPTR
jgi:hypothetical protein